MSDGKKVAAEEAREKVLIIRDMLKDQCDEIVIAGSLRRRKALVGDGEIVALPTYAPNLLARLDRMVAEQLIVKAAYGEKRTTRWGNKYRGFMYQGLRIELFVAEPENWGYILWLRTGPGEANAWVMQQCIQKHAPYRAVDGYWTDVESGRRIRTADEAEMFRLLGINYVVPPQNRSLALYAGLMRYPRWAKDVHYVVSEEPPTSTQVSLF